MQNVAYKDKRKRKKPW